MVSIDGKGLIRLEVGSILLISINKILFKEIN